MDGLGVLYLLGCSVPLLLVGVLWARNSGRLLRTGRRTTATVIGYEKDRDGEGTSPVVEFLDDHSATRRARLNLLRTPGVGETITILYDPAHPASARPANGVSLWLGPALFLVVGGLGVLAALVVLLELFRRF